MSKFYKKLVTASRPADPAINTKNYNGIWSVKNQRVLQASGIWNLGAYIPIDFLVVGGGGTAASAAGAKSGGGGGGFIENLGVTILLGKTISITAGTTATVSSVSLSLSNLSTPTYTAGGGSVGTSGSPQNNIAGLGNSPAGPGGGGAGGPGGNVTGSLSNGGPGLFSTILGRRVAGGGGGGNGSAGFGTAGTGVDGGGNGTNSSGGYGANANDFGGGGGAPSDNIQYTRGQGYPGVVVIRHLDIYNTATVVTGNPTIVKANGYYAYTFFNSTGSLKF